MPNNVNGIVNTIPGIHLDNTNDYVLSRCEFIIVTYVNKAYCVIFV